MFNRQIINEKKIGFIIVLYVRTRLLQKNVINIKKYIGILQRLMEFKRSLHENEYVENV